MEPNWAPGSELPFSPIIPKEALRPTTIPTRKIITRSVAAKLAEHEALSEPPNTTSQGEDAIASKDEPLSSHPGRNTGSTPLSDIQSEFQIKKLKKYSVRELESELSRRGHSTLGPRLTLCARICSVVLGICEYTELGFMKRAMDVLRLNLNELKEETKKKGCHENFEYAMDHVLYILRNEFVREFSNDDIDDTTKSVNPAVEKETVDHISKENSLPTARNSLAKASSTETDLCSEVTIQPSTQTSSQDHRKHYERELTSQDNQEYDEPRLTSRNNSRYCEPELSSKRSANNTIANTNTNRAFEFSKKSSREVNRAQDTNKAGLSSSMFANRKAFNSSTNAAVQSGGVVQGPKRHEPGQSPQNSIQIRYPTSRYTTEDMDHVKYSKPKPRRESTASRFGFADPGQNHPAATSSPGFQEPRTTSSLNFKDPPNDHAIQPRTTSSLAFREPPSPRNPLRSRNASSLGFVDPDDHRTMQPSRNISNLGFVDPGDGNITPRPFGFSTSRSPAYAFRTPSHTPQNVPEPSGTPSSLMFEDPSILDLQETVNNLVLSGLCDYNHNNHDYSPSRCRTPTQAHFNSPTSQPITHTALNQGKGKGNEGVESRRQCITNFRGNEEGINKCKSYKENPKKFISSTYTPITDPLTTDPVILTQNPISNPNDDFRMQLLSQSFQEVNNIVKAIVEELEELERESISLQGSEDGTARDDTDLRRLEDDIRGLQEALHNMRYCQLKE